VIPAKAGTTNVADSLNQAFLNTLSDPGCGMCLRRTQLSSRVSALRSAQSLAGARSQAPREESGISQPRKPRSRSFTWGHSESRML